MQKNRRERSDIKHKVSFFIKVEKLDEKVLLD